MDARYRQVSLCPRWLWELSLAGWLGSSSRLCICKSRSAPLATHHMLNGTLFGTGPTRKLATLPAARQISLALPQGHMRSWERLLLWGLWISQPYVRLQTGSYLLFPDVQRYNPNYSNRGRHHVRIDGRLDVYSADHGERGFSSLCRNKSSLPTLLYRSSCFSPRQSAISLVVEGCRTR